MKCLDLQGSDIYGYGFEHLTKLQKLETINISFSPLITDVLFEHLRHFTSLTRLELQYCDKISDSGIAQIASSLQRLKVINLQGCTRITDVAIDLIASCSLNLNKFYINDCPNLTDKSFYALKRIRSLTGLYLYKCEKLTPEGFCQLTTLGDLKELFLKRTHINDKSLEAFRYLVELERLHLGLGEPNITDSGLAHLAFLDKLQLLDLSTCQSITHKGIEHLTTLKKLIHLELQKCSQLDEHILPHLKQLTTLRYLDLSDTACPREKIHKELAFIKERNGCLKPPLSVGSPDLLRP